MRQFEELTERCGTYIGINQEANWKEIEFLCEQVVRMCGDWLVDNAVNGNALQSQLLEHCDLSDYS